MSVNYNPSVVTSGLVLNLDAANIKSYPASGTSWFDLSGNGNTGTLTNGPTFNSANGGSLIFNGINQYAIFPSPKPTTSMSVCAWVKPDTFDAAWHKILQFPYGDTSWIAPYFSYQLVIYQSNFGVSFGINTTYMLGHLADTSFIPSVGVWYYVCGTFQSGIIKIYVNGILKNTTDASASGTSIMYTTRTQALIANRAEYLTGETFKGNVANSQIYNRALSSQEILQNFNAMRGRYGL